MAAFVPLSADARDAIQLSSDYFNGVFYLLFSCAVVVLWAVCKFDAARDEVYIEPFPLVRYQELVQRYDRLDSEFVTFSRV